MHEGRSEVRVTSTSNAISVCEEILGNHKAGSRVALVYVGVGALAMAVKAVRRANEHLDAKTPTFLIYPQMERKLTEGGAIWFIGIAHLYSRNPDGTYT